MKQVIGLIDYGKAGNCHSVEKALAKAGGHVRIINDAKELSKVDKIVLPGVGSFSDGICELKKKNLFDTLKAEIVSKPTLGICLGMQILSKWGDEFGKQEGLSLFDAEVKKMICNLPTPHMGFSAISVQKKSVILTGVENEAFYFMHAYEVVNDTDVLALSSYGEHRFVSAIMKDMIFGVQFHPEKSREPGLQIFENFINL